MSAWPAVTVEARGPHDGQLAVNQSVDVTASVRLGGLTMRDVAVELVWGHDDNGRLRDAVVVPMTAGESLSDGRQTYAARFTPDRNGALLYGVRARPNHPALPDPNEMGLATWAE